MQIVRPDKCRQFCAGPEDWPPEQTIPLGMNDQCRAVREFDTKVADGSTPDIFSPA